MIRTVNGIKYELTRKNVRNINLRISGGIVKVSARRGIPAEYIDSFVASKRAFIERALTRESNRIPLSPPNVSTAEAVRYFTAITERIYPLFARFSFPFPVIKARLMKSQWGNCRRAQNTVTFNTYLCSLPERCAEFVAAHELAHMVVNDHSPAFYAVLREVMPDCDLRKKELSKFSLRSAPPADR